MTGNRGISRWFIAAASLCALPVFIPYYPPLLDLPQHVAAIMVLDESYFGAYRFADLFEFIWYRPYWFGYASIWLLGKIFGLVLAAKIVIAVAAIATVLGFACLRREVNAPAVLDWYFLAIPFGFAYHWGFLSFLVCVPLAPFFLVHYHRYIKGELAAWPIVLWVVVLFFGHLLMLAFLCLAASSMALRRPLTAGVLLKRIAPLTLSIPMGVAWIALTVQPHNMENPIVWNLGWQRLAGFFPDIFSLERSWLMVPVALVLLAIPIALGVRLKWRLHQVMPVLFYVAFMMLVPTTVYDNFGTYERFQVFGLMFFVLLLADADLQPPRLLSDSDWLLRAVPGVIGLTLLLRVAMQGYGFNQELQDFRYIMDRAEPRARAISLVGDRTSDFSPVPVYVHFPLWYQAEKKGLVDFNFAYWPSMTVHYRNKARPAADVVMAWYPTTFDWQRHGAENYRYFFVRGDATFVIGVLGQHAERLDLVASRGLWHLFERRSAAP